MILICNLPHTTCVHCYHMKNPPVIADSQTVPYSDLESTVRVLCYTKSDSAADKLWLLLISAPVEPDT